MFLTGGGPTLDAYDSRSGELIWTVELGARGYANPMTYATRDGRQYIAIAVGGGSNAMLKVFALADGDAENRGLRGEHTETAKKQEL